MANRNQVMLTFAGDSDQLEKAFGKVGEASRGMANEVGASSKRMANEVKGAGDSLDRFGRVADDVDTRAMGFRDSLTGVQDSMLGVSALAKGDLFDGLLLVGMGLGDIGSAIFNFVAPALKSLVERMGMAKLVLAGLALGVAGAGIGLIAWGMQARHTSEDIAGLTEDVKRFLRTGEQTTALRRHFGEGAQGVEEFGHKLDIASRSWMRATFAANASFDEISKAKSAFIDLDTAMGQLVDGGEDSEKVFNRLTATYQLNSDEVDELRALLPKYGEAAERAKERTGELATAQAEAAAATFAHIKNIKDLADTLKAQTDPVFAYVQAQKAVRDAQQAVNEAAKEFGRGSQEHRDAILGLAKAQLDLVGATSDAQGATDASLIPALKRLQTDGHLSKESLDAVTAAITNAKNAATALDNTRVRLRIDLLTRGQIPFGAGHLPGFHTGGVVPGAPGTEVIARLQAGEQVLTAAQQQSQSRGLGAGDLRMVSGTGLDRVFLQWLQGLLRSNNLQLVSR